MPPSAGNERKKMKKTGKDNPVKDLRILFISPPLKVP
jgi:hypothetical protein